jgi:hypothetical protein
LGAPRAPSSPWREISTLPPSAASAGVPVTVKSPPQSVPSSVCQATVGAGPSGPPPAAPLPIAVGVECEAPPQAAARTSEPRAMRMAARGAGLATGVKGMPIQRVIGPGDSPLTAA